MFRSYLKLKARSNLRGMMRGYRQLKLMGNQDSLMRAKELLASTKLNVVSSQCSEVIYGASIAYSEIVVRQFLLVMIVHKYLVRSMLLAIDPFSKNKYISAPLPKEWRLALQSQGLKISHFRSSIKWNIQIILFVGYGFLRFLKLTSEIFLNIRMKKRETKQYIYFYGLDKCNIPKLNGISNSFTIIDWYIKKELRYTQGIEICHSVKSDVVLNHTSNISITHQPYPIPLPRTYKDISLFLVWFTRTIPILLFDVLRFRWANAVMFSESVMAALVRHAGVDLFANEYLFNNSSLMYRPIWTYEVERLNSKVTYYFYSTNIEAMQTKQGALLPNFGYSPMNWPNYLVWDDFQAEFLKQNSINVPSIKIVGPIWFSCSGKIDIKKMYDVAIFDIEPHRHSRYCTLGTAIEYYVPSVVCTFLNDIADVLSSLDLEMAWKRKRENLKYQHPKYHSNAIELGSRSGVFIIDSGVSAFSLIAESKVVISIPFTSTALIAQYMNKPTAYYDPLAILKRDDPAAHGVKLLQGKSELFLWVSEVFDEFSNTRSAS